MNILKSFPHGSFGIMRVKGAYYVHSQTVSSDQLNL